MFTLQVGAIANQFAQVLPQAAIDALINVFGNCAQELEHRGPVNIMTAGDQPSLTLSNDNPGQSALTINKGSTNIKGDLIQDGNSYFNSPATFNNETYFNDDVIFPEGDMIIKYCRAGFGSTVARIKLKSKVVGGKAQAQIVDCNGTPIGNTNLSGIGSGEIEVHDCSQATYTCADVGQCGFAIYMSDCDPLGSNDDCTHRPNNGKWEIIKLNSGSLAGSCSVEVVSDVCCIGDSIIVCKKTLQFTEPVKVVDDTCSCP